MPNVQTLFDALENTKLPFAHYGWSKAPTGDYGVYGESGGVYLRADNQSAETATECTVDYFTRDPSGTPRATIEAALNGIQCAWYLNNVLFEDDTGFIHFEWVVEI